MNRFRKIQNYLSLNDIDIAFFLNLNENKRDKSILYFTDVDPEFSCLIISKKKSSFLIIGKLEEEKIKKETKIKVISLEKKLFDLVNKQIPNIKKIGVNFDQISINEEKKIKKGFSNKVKLVDISKELTNLRIQKSKEEVEKIKFACKITDNIFSKIIKNFNFKNENEIVEFIENEAKKKGCELAFPSIVASGASASMPHYDKCNSRIKKGFLLMDYGVRYKGYNSDMTRTIYVGTPNNTELEGYNTLLGIQKEAINQLRAGIDYKKIDKGVKDVLKEKIIHSLGHGLGIDVHEPISTNPKKAILKEGTVLTVEPGIYFPGKYGIRIEDDVLITKTGSEILTKSTKELIIIKK